MSLAAGTAAERRTARPPALGRETLTALAIFAMLALVPAVAPLYGGGYLTSLVMRAMILAVAVISLDLLIGHGGMVSFGHAAFVGIGAYVTGIMITEGAVEAAVILPAVIAACGAFAFVTGAISLRTSGVYFIMITLAFGQMAFFAAGSLSAYGADDGLTLWERAALFDTGAIESDLGLFYICLATLAGAWALVGAVVASRFGRVLRAAKENPVRVGTMGFDVVRYRLAAYVLAGVIAGIAGFLLANQAEFVSPAAMAWQRSGDLLVMVVLGGMAARNGPLYGALFFVLIEEALSSVTHDWRLIFGPLLVVIVLYTSGGLASLVARATGGRG